MDVYLETLGCRLNEAELENWHRKFVLAGHRVVNAAARAQVVVLNTCAVTTMAARKSRQHVHRLHRQNPEASLVITGCYAEMEPQKLASLAGVDLVVGNQDKRHLVELVEENIDPTVMPSIATEPEAEGSHVYAQTRTRAFVKVQDGCRNRCTFCIVTVLRGQERSRTIAEIVEQVQALQESGYQEVVLTGVHLGGYGSDIGSNLRELVQAVLENTDVPRIRLTSLEPWDLPENFWSLWQNPRLGAHLHLPLQSGCDSTLKRMARRCFTDEYTGLVTDARAMIPNVTITTDLIVGFPGETEAEWRASYDFVESIGFGHMHIFTYSPREGTTAARMRGHLTKAVKKERSRQLHELAARMKQEHLERFLGQTHNVLWEGEAEALDNGRVLWSGYTHNYLRTTVETEASVHLENKITPVVLTEIDGERYKSTLA